jgi:type II secretory pathway pseudopilin PulG
MTRSAATSPGTSRRCARPRARGIVLLALLMMILLGAIFSTRAIEVWATARQREKEAELLFVGEQYRAAIRHYYFSSPNARTRALPTRLEDLLLDDRFPVPVRHLRRLYPDPISGGDFELLRQGNRIAGVYSASNAQPLKIANFDNKDQSTFVAKSSYREWVFVFVAPKPAPPRRLTGPGN